VQDNGPGLPASTIERSLDYLVRVSDKAHYVSPSRGQLGNALKCVWAAPYVARGEQGAVEVVTGGIQHRISVTLDRIAEQPILHHETATEPFVKTGTLVLAPCSTVTRALFTKVPGRSSPSMPRLIPMGAFSIAVWVRRAMRESSHAPHVIGANGPRVIPPPPTGIPTNASED
jgi:hypothetical protein